MREYVWSFMTARHGHGWVSGRFGSAVVCRVAWVVEEKVGLGQRRSILISISTTTARHDTMRPTAAVLRRSTWKGESAEEGEV